MLCNFPALDGGDLGLRRHDTVGDDGAGYSARISRDESPYE